MYARVSTLGSVLVLGSLLTACAPGEPGEAGMEDDTMMQETMESPAEAEAAVRQVRERYVQAYNAGNAAEVANLYAQDGVLMPAEGGSVTGRSAIQSALEEAVGQGAQLQVDAEETTVAGEWAFDRGRYSVRMTPQGGQAGGQRGAAQPMTLSGHYVVVLRRGPEGWKIQWLISNVEGAPGGMQPGGERG